MRAARFFKKTIQFCLPKHTIRTHRPSLHIIKNDVESVLNSFKEIDFIRQNDIDVLERAFQNAPDKAQASHLVLMFANQYYEKAVLLYASALFRNQNPRNTSLRLIILAAAYAAGQFEDLENIADELLALSPSPMSWALKARALFRTQGLKAEQNILKQGLKHFPNDHLLRLHLINSTISDDRVDEANAMIETMRPFIEKTLSEEIQTAKKTQKDLISAMEKDSEKTAEKEDIYTDEFCRLMWSSYYESFTSKNSRQHGDSMLREAFLEMLKTVAQDTDILLDFGAMCADPIYQAGLTYPNIEFYGCDRQPFIATLNNAAYPLPNLHFHEGDIFESLEKLSTMQGKKTLLHIRTSTVVYPHFLAAFYKRCAETKFDTLLFIENAGMSRVDLKFRDINTMEEQAIVTKHRLCLHNYKSVLDKAGYDIVDYKRLCIPALWNGFGTDAYVGSQYAVIAKRRTT